MSAHHDLPTRLWRRFRNWLRAKRLVSLLDDYGIQVVVTNTASIDIGHQIAQGLQVPHLWIVHEFMDLDHGLVFDCGMESAYSIIDQSDEVFVVSESVKAHMTPHLKQRDLVIWPASVVANEFDGYEECVASRAIPPLKLLLIGQIHPGKCQLDAVKAMVQLVQANQPVELTLLGTGDQAYLKTIRQYIVDEDLEKSVHLAGFVSQPQDLMREHHVVLMCSRSEAFGRVIVEAQKWGKPVIGTRIGGTAEIVQDGITGWLYPAGDVTALVEKIRWFLEHSEAIDVMGRAAYTHARSRYTLESTVDCFMRSLDRVVT